MDDFINVNKKNPQIRISKNNMLDRYNKKPYYYQSEVGYDTLIQNVILKELIILMDATITDIDIESNMKISRINT